MAIYSSPVFSSHYAYKSIKFFSIDATTPAGTHTLDVYVSDSHPTVPAEHNSHKFRLNREDEEALFQALSIRRDIRTAHEMNQEFDRRIAVRKFYTTVLADFPTLEVADDAFDAILRSFNQNENVLGEKFGIDELVFWR